jgi:Zn-dependent peptidase ImmA (M78 family)
MKVKYLSYEQIAERTQQILKEYKCESTIPVPVEQLIDNILQINIVPFPNLLRNFEINALTSSDLKTIYVDEYLYTNLEPQYRFTLAHEFGHIVLHKYIYEKVSIQRLDDWKRFIIEVDEKEYRKLEIQANNFAGLLLVPQDILARYFISQIRSLGKSFDKAEREKFKRDDYLDLVVDLISHNLASVFLVDHQVVRIRLEKSNLPSKIP